MAMGLWLSCTVKREIEFFTLIKYFSVGLNHKFELFYLIALQLRNLRKHLKSHLDCLPHNLVLPLGFCLRKFHLSTAIVAITSTTSERVKCQTVKLIAILYLTVMCV